MLGLHCCVGFSPVLAHRDYSLVAVCRLTAVASRCRARHIDFSSCSSWALENRLNSWGAWA